MKTDTVKPLQVDTWLPVFSGFYGTIWETDSDEEMELENINEERKKKGLEPIEWDVVEWDYKEYKTGVVEGITSRIDADLRAMGLVFGVRFQELRSPREYNFANDSIDVEILITRANTKKILAYLKEHSAEFSEYLKERYTTRSGFISSYSPDVETWLDGETTAHSHKLGSVLQFILENENGERYEEEIYERLHSNGVFLTAANYSELVPE